MPGLPEQLSNLVTALSKLPGIGPRSAERIALHIVQSEKGAIKTLADALLNARESIHFCNICGALTEQITCSICSDPRRDTSLICLVERPVDVLSVEKAGTFRGKYHVLGGRISPINGIGPEDLRISELESRLSDQGVKEVIVALATDVEGDATSYYLAKRLNREGLRVTRIAHGLPAGSGLDYADEVTLSRAMEGRREL